MKLIVGAVFLVLGVLFGHLQSFPLDWTDCEGNKSLYTLIEDEQNLLNANTECSLVAGPQANLVRKFWPSGLLQSYYHMTLTNGFLF